MTTSLPEGIILHTDSVAGDIKQADVITVEDVRFMWGGRYRVDPTRVNFHPHSLSPPA
jgi:hypothetical protein